MKPYKKTKQFTIRLSPGDMARLEELSRDLSLSYANCIRMMINDWSHKHKTGKIDEIRDRIITKREAPTVTKPVETPGGVTQEDWDNLAYEEKHKVMEAYRKMTRDKPYDTSVEEYFKFIENAKRRGRQISSGD